MIVLYGFEAGFKTGVFLDIELLNTHHSDTIIKFWLSKLFCPKVQVRSHIYMHMRSIVLLTFVLGLLPSLTTAGGRGRFPGYPDHPGYPYPGYPDRPDDPGPERSLDFPFWISVGFKKVSITRREYQDDFILTVGPYGSVGSSVDQGPFLLRDGTLELWNQSYRVAPAKVQSPALIPLILVKDDKPGGFHALPARDVFRRPTWKLGSLLGSELKRKSVGTEIKTNLVSQLRVRGQRSGRWADPLPATTVQLW